MIWLYVSSNSWDIIRGKMATSSCYHCCWKKPRFLNGFPRVVIRCIGNQYFSQENEVWLVSPMLCEELWDPIIPEDPLSFQWDWSVGKYFFKVAYFWLVVNQWFHSSIMSSWITDFYLLWFLLIPTFPRKSAEPTFFDVYFNISSHRRSLRGTFPPPSFNSSPILLM